MENLVEEVLKVRQKYVEAELEHYRKTGEKNKILRAKVSVIDELLNNLGYDNKKKKEDGKV